MDQNAKPSFIRPEVRPLYDISFAMCGLMYRDRCGASPACVTGAHFVSDLHYYLLAEWAHDHGWIPGPDGEVSLLCQKCAGNPS